MIIIMKIILTIILKISLIYKMGEWLIICVCNSISDKAINTAVISGANTPSLVYKSCGAKPQCGSCSEYIKQEINQVQTTEK